MGEIKREEDLTPFEPEKEAPKKDLTPFEPEEGKHQEDLTPFEPKNPAEKTPEEK